MSGYPQEVVNLVQQSPKLQGLSLQAELGEGGMGKTYLLQDPSGGKSVLKVMKNLDALDRQGRARFVREIQHTGELSHPNIVTLFDSGEHAGDLFYTMEFCAGGSADKLVPNPSKKLPPERAIAIILDVLAGLAFAHDAPVKDVKLEDGTKAAGRGIVHRDLKPSNIFLDASGRAKIADFGLAKAFEFAGRSGVTLKGQSGGTLGFQPRQQLKSFVDAKPEIDVWAAAASLYYLMTGALTRDFPARKNPRTTIQNTAPVPIRSRDPGIPAALAEVIDRALDDTGERLHYQIAAKLSDDLVVATASIPKK